MVLVYEGSLCSGLAIEGVIERMSEFTDEKVLVNGPADQEEPKQETAALETEMETVEQEASRLSQFSCRCPT